MGDEVTVPKCVNHADMKGTAWAYVGTSRSHIKPVCQTCLGDPEYIIEKLITANSDTWTAPKYSH